MVEILSILHELREVFLYIKVPYNFPEPFQRLRVDIREALEVYVSDQLAEEYRNEYPE